MSGLIYKDLALLAQRKSSLLLIMAIGVFMGFSMEGSFVVGYISMLSVIISMSTISYDEFDNGYPFLPTLPITRKLYVQSKYLFSIVAGAVGWLFGVLVYLLCSLVQGIPVTGDDLLSAVIMLPVFFLMLALMLPLQLKYGAEGSRVVIMVIGGCVAVIFFLGRKIFPQGPKLPAFLTQASDLTISAVFLAVAVATGILSYCFSVKIMEEKTF
ncbi:MAG: ABC-2 transporter permease [Lachnospiraceae bacterium]|nr:ABC-2 transporter permease [Lachnospiraceae bacterium]